jgi:MYXO-CTERM domain-containing protein
MHKTIAVAGSIALMTSAAHAQYTAHIDTGLRRATPGGVSATIDAMSGDTTTGDFFRINFVFDQPLRVDLVDGATDVALYANFRLYTEQGPWATSPVHAKNRWSTTGALGSANMHDRDIMRGRFIGTSGRGLMWGSSFRADDSVIDGYTFDAVSLYVRMPDNMPLDMLLGKLSLGITGSPESGFVTVPAPASLAALVGLAAIRRRR